MTEPEKNAPAAEQTVSAVPQQTAEISYPALLTVSSSPHLKNTDTTRSLMLDVIIALLPAFASDRYGSRWAGVNYGLLALGMSAGSLAFPQLARRLQGQAAPHWIAAAAAAAGFVCLLLYGRGQRRAAGDEP